MQILSLGLEAETIKVHKMRPTYGYPAQNNT